MREIFLDTIGEMAFGDSAGMTHTHRFGSLLRGNAALLGSQHFNYACICAVRHRILSSKIFRFCNVHGTLFRAFQVSNSPNLI